MSQTVPSSLTEVVPTVGFSTVSPAWKTALPALALAWAVILLLYRDTAISMVTIWYRSETFTHCFVVLPISLWLVWRRREELASMVPKPSPWVLLPIAGIALLWLLGDLVVVNSVTQLALVSLLVLSVPALLGMAVARAIAFPLLFLFFSVPIGEFLMPQLMESTADFTVLALRASGIPVYREGLQFVIPSGNWSVVEACSGVRYLIASLTVGTLFAYLNYQSTKRRVIFVFIAILVPVVANWLRAYMIVMLGHLSGNKLAVGADHLVYGWVFFGIVIMLLFFIGAKWSEPEPEVGAQVNSVRSGSVPWMPARLWGSMACLAVIVAMPAAAKLAMEHSATVAVPALALPAALADGWQASAATPVAFKPSFEGPSAEAQHEFSKGGQVVGLYLAFYRHQDYEHKLVNSNNVLVPSNDKTWNRVESGSRPTKMGSHEVTVTTSELRNLGAHAPDENGRLVAWQIYWINGTLTASDYAAKVYSAGQRLLGRGDDSAAIVVYAVKNPRYSAEGALQSFMAENYTAIDAILRRARESGR